MAMNRFVACMPKSQVSFLELIANTLQDFTLLVLIASGVISIVLEQLFGSGEHGWVEGAAILAAVAVVALVTAVNDFEKEQQFRELSALSSETQVRRFANCRGARSSILTQSSAL
jgi:magnesium-transporting ATPase (P-type)